VERPAPAGPERPRAAGTAIVDPGEAGKLAPLPSKPRADCRNLPAASLSFEISKCDLVPKGVFGICSTKQMTPAAWLGPTATSRKLVARRKTMSPDTSSAASANASDKRNDPAKQTTKACTGQREFACSHMSPGVRHWTMRTALNTANSAGLACLRSGYKQLWYKLFSCFHNCNWLKRAIKQANANASSWP
jgi:hypothetical protein